MISIELREEELYFSLYDFKQVTFEDVMREYWHPSIKIVDIAEKSIEFVKKNAIPFEKVPNRFARIVHGVINLDKPLLKLFQLVFLIKLLLIVAVTFYDAFTKQFNPAILGNLKQI